MTRLAGDLKQPPDETRVYNFITGLPVTSNNLRMNPGSVTS
jgi:hypothetical protein